MIGEGEIVVSIGLLVYVTAPMSGGHINPLVSIATFLAGLSSFPRVTIYVTFQLLGGTIGAFLVRAIYGDRLPGKVIMSLFRSYWKSFVLQ